jgi:hypothetical protein
MIIHQLMDVNCKFAPGEQAGTLAHNNIPVTGTSVTYSSCVLTMQWSAQA